jgi:hypothetical protein
MDEGFLTRRVLIEKSPFLVYHHFGERHFFVQNCICDEDLKIGCDMAGISYETIKQNRKPSDYYLVMEDVNYKRILFKKHCSIVS